LEENIAEVYVCQG